jgi:5-formyltetrahydrofolate cyclo-ligase
MPQNLKPLRQQIKKKLQNLNAESCLTTSQTVATKIIATKIFVQSQNIACYIPIKNEIDVWPIIKAIWSCGKNCYLPTFEPKTKHYLQFVKFNERDRLTIVKYNIPQPKIYLKKIIAPQDLDLVIVPLLGFNTERFRLGRGAGYYDHTFAFKKQNPKIKPYLLGAGYTWQRIDFEQHTWDMMLDEIVTA